MKQKVLVLRIINEPGFSGHRVVMADRTSVCATLLYFSRKEAIDYAENSGYQVVNKPVELKPRDEESS
jgi:hypothetical protein